MKIGSHHPSSLQAFLPAFLPLALALSCVPTDHPRSAAPAAADTEPLPSAAAPAPRPPSAVDFASQVRPILAAQCQPCHFPGGKMHDHLPFDDPATIRELGTRLFTRIQDADQQAVIRAFLAQAR